MRTIKISQKTAYDLAKWLDEQCAIKMHRKFDGDNFTVYNSGTQEWLQLSGETEEARIGFMLIAHINGITKFYVEPMNDPKLSVIAFYLPYGFELIKVVMVIDATEAEAQGVLKTLLETTYEVA